MTDFYAVIRQRARVQAQLGGVNPNVQRLNADTVLVTQETVDESAVDLRELRKVTYLRRGGRASV